MKIKTLLGSFLCLLLMAGSAFAYSLPLNTDPAISFNNILHDTSGEYVLTGDTEINVGDVLAGHIIIDRINTDEIGTGTGYDELTAYFEARVESVTGNDTDGYSYTFESNTSGAAGDGTIDTGAMAWFYTDPSGNATFSDPTTMTDGGNLWAVLGLTDSDTAWTAWTFTDDILALATAITLDPQNGNDYGNFVFTLDVIENYTALTFNDVGISNTQFTGQGHFTPKTGDYANVYQIGDQADMYINTVPEPATMSLFGFGLLAMAGIIRRKN